MSEFYSRAATVADMPFIMGEFEDGARKGHFYEGILTSEVSKTFEQQLRLQVLRLLREGCTNADIARRLFVAERTVGSHVENIFRKTGSSNRLQAAMWAFRMAL